MPEKPLVFSPPLLSLLSKSSLPRSGVPPLGREGDGIVLSMWVEFLAQIRLRKAQPPRALDTRTICHFRGVIGREQHAAKLLIACVELLPKSFGDGKDATAKAVFFLLHAHQVLIWIFGFDGIGPKTFDLNSVECHFTMSKATAGGTNHFYLIGTSRGGLDHPEEIHGINYNGTDYSFFFSAQMSLMGREVTTWLQHPFGLSFDVRDGATSVFTDGERKVAEAYRFIL
ncbi:hypothetical protein C1H46_009830 [Malus baccata]|uniref:Uncharacterized protein n=1 Tax=Malus baccata TaxID=106549 RepID=A0A540N1V9_MALBA|nr:hypothetical protein C1H46_009830 [Malus baccata]